MLVCSIPCALLEVVFEGESMLCHCCSLYHHVARCASSRRGRAPLHVSVSVISDQHLQSQSRFSKSVETRSAHDQNISWVVSTQRYTRCEFTQCSFYGFLRRRIFSKIRHRTNKEDKETKRKEQLDVSTRARRLREL
jgi:hypothetical protein